MIKLNWEEAALVVLFSAIGGGLIERHAWLAVCAAFVMVASLLFVGQRQNSAPVPPQERP